MMFYDYSADVPEDALNAFVSAEELGRLVTADASGQPHIGLYPFVFLGAHIEMHLHREDEQLADLRANPKCVFEVDEIHGSVPSHWTHPENAMFATAYHRTVVFDCEAQVIEDADLQAAQQQRLMQHYQPQGGHAPVSAELAMYRPLFNIIAGLNLRVVRRRAKWKLGQNRKPEARALLISQLRQRGRPTDGSAADALQWALDHSLSKR